MLLALVTCNLFVSIVANPFHKYPFVFLLDVGNEELQKTNTEQIRISVPGGSIALRYPAIGDGETIAHVRVSGIDFGTDLKANIVDGGPGSKYVVLVFMGNLGIPYDAVITVQTVSNDKNDLNTQNIASNINNESEENDFNNSAEELNDKTQAFKSPNQVYIERSNAELTQSSSNMYAYAQNEVINSEGSDFKAKGYSFDEDDNLEIKNYNEGDGETDEINIPRVELHHSEAESDNEIQDIERQSSVVVPDKSSDTSDDLDDDTQFESQVNKNADYSEDSADYEDQYKKREDEGEVEHMFDYEEMHFDDDKHKDSNNNDNYDNEDSFAVAS